MRKLAVATSLALVIVSVAVGAVSATHSLGIGPKMDLVAGTGTLDVSAAPNFPQDPQFHVNAKRDPDTGDAQGRFYVRVPTTTGQFDMRGEIVCLDVLVHSATLIGRIDRVSGTSPYAGGGGFVPNNYFQIDITDNGEPGTLDQVNFHVGTPTEPQTCTATAGGLLLSQGNFIVHDYPPESVLAILDLLIQQFEAAAGYPFDD